MELRVTYENRIPTAEREIEIVERKGLGHPDQICDLIAEAISVRLASEYEKRFGTILHYNVDKLFLAAGRSKTRFGGGEIEAPITLVFGDRATSMVGEEKIDINSIVIDTAREWIRRNLRFLDPEQHVRYQVEIKPVAENLAEIFRRAKNDILPANDTSAVIGYAPLTPTEKLVLDLEGFLNSKRFKREYPFTGEDVKVMGRRVGKKVFLTIAMSFVDRFVESESDYFKKKETIINVVNEWLKERGYGLNYETGLNILDEKGKGEAGCYLTVTGTSAEAGDSGEVGRGNGVNGIITLSRPMSREAAAGKNPISHTGKIYNVLATSLAEDIYERIESKEVYVWMLSSIGRLISDPPLVHVELVRDSPPLPEEVREIEELVKERLEKINEFCRGLARGKFSVS